MPTRSNSVSFPTQELVLVSSPLVHALPSPSRSGAPPPPPPHPPPSCLTLQPFLAASAAAPLSSRGRAGPDRRRSGAFLASFFSRRCAARRSGSGLGIGWCGDEYEAGGAGPPLARPHHHVAVRVEAADRGRRRRRPGRRAPPPAAARQGGRRQGKDNIISREKHSTTQSAY